MKWESGQLLMAPESPGFGTRTEISSVSPSIPKQRQPAWSRTPGNRLGNPTFLIAGNLLLRTCVQMSSEEALWWRGRAGRTRSSSGSRYRPQNRRVRRIVRSLVRLVSVLCSPLLGERIQTSEGGALFIGFVGLVRFGIRSREREVDLPP